jgi:predicted nucleic acid-binding protein
VSYVLDSTVIIDYAIGYPPGEEIVRRLFEEGSDLYTCEVVTCETLSRGGETEVRAVAALLEALEFVALDPSGARWAGDKRRSTMESGGRKVSTTDALIAALAHRLGATVVTRNAADFQSFDVPVLGYGVVSASS